MIVIVFGFTTTCAISAYHHQRCKFESRSWRGVLEQHYVIKFVSDSRQVGGFFGYSVFPTNKTDRHNITEIVLKVALNTIHQPTKPSVGCEKTIMMNQYRLLLITTELKLQSLNNWMLSFFRNQNRSLLHMQNINCKSH